MSTATNFDDSKSAAPNTFNEMSAPNPAAKGAEAEVSGVQARVEQEAKHSGSGLVNKIVDDKEDGPAQTERFKNTDQKPVGEL